MRRRPRTPAIPRGWVTARGDGRWTRVGNLDSRRPARVDGAGLVQVDGATWSLDWWIGAEDRWHVPSREAAVRQGLVGNSPVVETKVKVPGGDVVQRAYAARTAAGHEALVVEVENGSSLPVALALAVRPYALDGPGRIGSIAVEGSTVLVDDRPALTLPKAPARVALGDAAVDTGAVALGGGAVPTAEAVPVRCREGLAQGVFLFPLAHTARLRVTLPLGVDEVLPTAVPDAAQVAKGWGVQTRRAARFEVPERRVREAMLASGRHLLLAPPSVATATALDLLGFADEAGWALVGDRLALDTPVEAALTALARHWAFDPDAEVARHSAPVVATLIGRLGAAAGGHGNLVPVLGDLARLLDAADEPTAAADVRRLLTAPPPPGPRPVDDLDGLLASASGTWTWEGPGGGHDAGVNAMVIERLRARLVDDEGPDLDLSPGVPDAWLGQGWEVHDAPTRHGRLSYAVRWHGERPALLWELHPHGPDPVRLRATRLDPGWTSSEPAGEALLASMPLPERPKERRGLSIPVTIEPLRRGLR